MAEFEESPRRTQREPGVTHVDQPTGETRRDPSTSPSVPDETRSDAGPPLIRLPGALTQRFTVVSELPVQGAESDLVLVRTPAESATGGTEYVVKIFRRGYGADREVWQKLPALDSAHVVRILETGHADGRDYEVIEYAPAGNLRSLMVSEVTPTEVASQLAAGLNCLHRTGIVHRDLKPENVLVAAVQPLRLVITDFGLSKVIDQTVVFASSSRTLAYAAPESLSGQVSPARDWWSLGMIVREVVTGRPPFHGMSEIAVVDHLATRPIDNDDIPDARLRLLCQGLLTRDPRRRWGGMEVAQWLDGGSPTVALEPTRARQETGGPELPFSGRHYTERADLARALVADWDTAARYFFGRGDGSEAWRSLRKWLGGYNDDSRITLVDNHLTGDHTSDVKLLYLVRWLDPGLPPHYLGHRITGEDLAALVALASDTAHAEHRRACVIGRSLWEHDVLPVLAGFADASELTEIHARWRGRVMAWNELTERLRGELPPSVAARLPHAGAPGHDDPPIVLLTLLALASRPEETARTLADAASRAQASVQEPVPWFRWLADGAADDPLRLLAVVRAAPDAVIEAETQLRNRQAAQRQAAERRRHWEQRESRRLAGRNAAITRAILWSLLLLALWLLGSLVARGLVIGGRDESIHGVGRDTDPLRVFLIMSVAAWTTQTALEGFVAYRQARDYLPLQLWPVIAWVFGVIRKGLSHISLAMFDIAGGPRSRMLFALLLAISPMLAILGLAALLVFAWPLWMATMVLAPIGHGAAAAFRLKKWRQAHEQAKREALGMAM